MSSDIPRPLFATPRWLLAFLTWGGCGLSPWAPGTIGSLGALPCAALIAWLAGPAWSTQALLLAALVLFILGVIASQAYVRQTGLSDPGMIVIDEVVGQWITLAVAPLAPLPYCVAFLLFRFFDITKPFPIGWIDRHLHGGLGIMLDDVLAGGYAALLLWFLVPCLLF